MLDSYCQNVLKTELQKADYNGLTADQGWAWLMLPTAQAPLAVPTGVMLTPLVVAHLLGPAKAEAVAAAMKTAFPTIADHLLTVGVDPLDATVQGFLANLVTAGTLTSGDAAALLATGTKSVAQPNLPPRFDTRFEPALWSHVAADGTTGGPTDQAIHGFPNNILRADFDIAWTAAGRN